MNKAKEEIAHFGGHRVNLRRRVAHGAMWILGLRVLTLLLGLGRTVVLARILAPDDFGLMAIALVFIAVLMSFSETGFEKALIQKKEQVADYLDAAWTMQLIRGVVVAIIMLLTAPSVASFFQEPRITSIIMVLALCPFLNGVVNIRILYFQKDLEFHKEFIYRLSGIVADLIVSITAVLILRNVWALVFGSLASHLGLCVTSYILSPYRPTVKVDWSQLRELFSFGGWLLGLSVLTFLATRGPHVFLGKVIGTAALGFYQIAFRLANLPVTEISKVIGKVVFPAYCRLQDNLSQLREGFLKTLEAMSFLLFPVVAGIIILGSDFTHLFLGNKWMPMVPALILLSVSGLIRAITAGLVFVAVGNPHLSFWQMSIRMGVMAITIYPLTVRYGITGTAVSVLLSLAAYVPYWAYFVARTVKCGYKELFGRLHSPLVVVILMSAIVLTIKMVIRHTDFLCFILCILAALITYAVYSLLLWRQYKKGPIEVLQNLRSAL